MLDRLIDLFLDFLKLFQFWAVINEYERGVCKTLGKRRPRDKWWRFWKKKSVVLGPGLHLVWPLRFDEVLTDNIVPTTDAFGEQSVTTYDGKAITLSAVVMWSISDIEKILFNVEDSDSAFEESICGIIGDLVAATTWNDIHQNGFQNRVEKAVRSRVKKWGIRVHSVQFKNLTQSRAIRLL